MDKINTCDLFNDAKALKTSHGDQSIALKLRQMFINDLPTQLDRAKALLQSQDYQTLQSHLHHLLGGAQVCAADALIDNINKIKTELKSNDINLKKIAFIWQKIETMNAEMQASLNDPD
ncbi:Hpt domain-containing protein [Marinicella rhabdoformis]|uniref:Hpt domain-containing protein n=1 Tax=Marinicella rhabdoformis TaxID=2580566 RepID=UPI0012AEE033|nr:Hpt domain-containing protein [Marinicella rhabdoformis]